MGHNITRKILFVELNSLHNFTGSTWEVYKLRYFRIKTCHSMFHCVARVIHCTVDKKNPEEMNPQFYGISLNAILKSFFGLQSQPHPFFLLYSAKTGQGAMWITPHILHFTVVSWCSVLFESMEISFLSFQTVYVGNRKSMLWNALKSPVMCSLILLIFSARFFRFDMTVLLADIPFSDKFFFIR